MKRIHYLIALLLLIAVSVGFVLTHSAKTVTANSESLAPTDSVSASKIGDTSHNMENRIAKDKDKVAVDYWLTVDGKQVDTSEGRGVFEFTLGAGEVIPGFDKAVIGMAVGEGKNVELRGKDAYTQGPLAGKVLKFRIVLREILE